MASDPLFVLAFTVVPFVALGGGFVVSIWYATRVDRRLLAGTALFALMGTSQLTEVWVLLAGGDPHATLSGELIETTVNLLAVLVVLGLARSLEAEQRRRERQAVLTRELGGGSVLGEAESDSDVERRGLFNPTVLGLPVVGRVVAWAFTSLPLGTTANLSTVIETAARNLQVTYPATVVDRDPVPDLTVFAEATTLADILETVLKQLVLYNDSSEPTIEITIETTGSTVRVRISDNGPGLPAAVADQLAGTADDSVGPDLELGPVHSLLEKWGGSIGVTDGAVELTLLRPRPQQKEPGA